MFMLTEKGSKINYAVPFIYSCRCKPLVYIIHNIGALYNKKKG